MTTGSRPRIPDWAEPDGDRVLTTRHAYPPPGLPEHLVVIGSGVTGVEFVHLFSSLGSKVTLVVSRQQVLPQKDPEVAAALEENFLSAGRQAAEGGPGRRAWSGATTGSPCSATTVAGWTAPTPCSRIGSIPNSEALGLDAAGVEGDETAMSPSTTTCARTSAHIYAAGDLSGKLPLSSVAAMQGRKIAEHVMGLHTREHRHLDYDKAASAIFTEPEIADVGLAEADAFAIGRKIRVTKVPFSANAKAMINDATPGFVKIVSDPATGVVLGRLHRRPPCRRAHRRGGPRGQRRAHGHRPRRLALRPPDVVRVVGRSRRLGRAASSWACSCWACIAAGRPR